jgi:hypothetical protein
MIFCCHFRAWLWNGIFLSEIHKEIDLKNRIKKPCGGKVLAERDFYHL